MKTIHLDTVAKTDSRICEACVATVGVFDGMHQGHLRVLHMMQEISGEATLPRTVVTFITHPDEFLGKSQPSLILPIEHRLRLLERNGVDLTVILPFNTEIRETTALHFLKGFIMESLGARALVLGYDSAFGKNREGNFDFIKKHSDSLGFTVHSAPEISVRGKAISSTRIRDAIRGGDIDLAEEMLGREVSILGKVVHGDGRGRQLGFPTANVEAGTDIIPPSGVYEIKVLFRGIRRKAVLSIGTRPTFHGTTEATTTLEVHIPGFSGDIYDEILEIFIVRKIRDQKRFDSVEELLQNIRRDIETLGRPAARNNTR